MKYRQMGNTGLMLSEIGFGCGPSAGLMLKGTRQERREILGCALDAGINFFDTSAGYGNGLSELNLGETLKDLNAKPIVASKVILQQEDRNDIFNAVINSVEGSLKRLNVESIALIQLHNRIAVQKTDRIVGIGPLLTLREVMGDRGVLEALEKLRHQGKVRFFGFTTYGGDATAIQEAIASGRWQMINAVYHLLNPSAGATVSHTFAVPDYERVIDLAAHAGLGVAVIRVLGEGLLTGRIPSGIPLQIQKKIQNLAFLCEGGQTLAQAAIRFALTKSQVSTVVMGISNLEHVQHAVNACELGELTLESLHSLRTWYEEGISSD